jgi:hypothetical protein
MNGVNMVIDRLPGGAMRQRQPQRRRSPRRRRGRPLAKLVAWSTLVSVAIGFLSWQSDTKATDREHESRRARESIADYRELDADVGRWLKGAKFVYRASASTYRETGRWPRGSDSEAYGAVIDAGTDVKRLQARVSDRRLVNLLNALRRDIGDMCAAISVHAANRASTRMVAHSEQVTERIDELRKSKLTRLQLLGAAVSAELAGQLSAARN